MIARPTGNISSNTHRRGNSTPKYLPPIQNNPLAQKPEPPKDRYKTTGRTRVITNSVNRSMVDGYSTNKSVIDDNKRRINLSLSQERPNFQKEKERDKEEHIGYGDVSKVINEINHHLPSETEGSQKSLKHKKSKELKELNTSYDNIKNQITDVVEFQKSPVADKRQLFPDPSINYQKESITNKERNDRIEELWNNIQNYRSHQSLKEINTSKDGSRQLYKSVSRLNDRSTERFQSTELKLKK